MRHLLAARPAEEVAVFQDEVDLDPTPKIEALFAVEGSAHPRPPAA